jgi:hypothetical protein
MLPVMLAGFANAASIGIRRGGGCLLGLFMSALMIPHGSVRFIGVLGRRVRLCGIIGDNK